MYISAAYLNWHRFGREQVSLLVISYPELEQKGYEWIQSVRAEHDKLGFQLINPHFTLVFQVDDVSQSAFVDHVRAVSTDWGSIPFTLRRAEILSDADTGCSYTVLTPDEGYSEIVKLHDRLYTGELADKVRLDTPYVPHITVGNSKEPRICKVLCDRLNGSDFSAAGRIRSIDVISYDGTRITTIERILLPDKS